jgi:hypothetical protein
MGAAAGAESRGEGHHRAPGVDVQQEVPGAPLPAHLGAALLLLHFRLLLLLLLLLATTDIITVGVTTPSSVDSTWKIVTITVGYGHLHEILCDTHTHAHAHAHTHNTTQHITTHGSVATTRLVGGTFIVVVMVNWVVVANAPAALWWRGAESTSWSSSS